jgi:hypothetical protein
VGFHTEFPGEEGEGAPFDKVGPHHGKRSLVSLWEFLEEKVGDREVKDGVAEKFQHLIRDFFGSGSLMDERLVGEGTIEPFDLLKAIIQTSFQLP